MREPISEVAWLRHGDFLEAEYEQSVRHQSQDDGGEDFRTFMGSFPRSAYLMSASPPSMRWLRSPDTTDISDNDQLDEAARHHGQGPQLSSSVVVAMSRCCT